MSCALLQVVGESPGPGAQLSLSSVTRCTQLLGSLPKQRHQILMRYDALEPDGVARGSSA